MGPFSTLVAPPHVLTLKTYLSPALRIPKYGSEGWGLHVSDLHATCGPTRSTCRGFHTGLLRYIDGVSTMRRSSFRASDASRSKSGQYNAFLSNCPQGGCQGDRWVDLTSTKEKPMGARITSPSGICCLTAITTTLLLVQNQAIESTCRSVSFVPLGTAYATTSYKLIDTVELNVAGPKWVRANDVKK